ncbi:hypothetical protein, partial [Salinisphaera sp. G21_0]|uniref:hypothetical protein n=1 Tax=Salinisphaera sp. G21_0 TaxID=2821094 RepID=UPI001AD95FD4
RQPVSEKSDLFCQAAWLWDLLLDSALQQLLQMNTRQLPQPENLGHLAESPVSGVDGLVLSAPENVLLPLFHNHFLWNHPVGKSLPALKE